jgi:Fe-S cluster biogenesis protein NfuA
MIQFRIQSTPNPQARKYILNRELKAQGKVTYKTVEECQHVPLAIALFGINGVKQVHFFENVLTVTQDGQDWSLLDTLVQEVMTQCLDKHDIYFEDYLAKETTRVRPSKWTPEMERIDGILDDMIRPSLQFDGGDIEVLEFENDILTVRYMGACGGCPSSMSGTLEAIKGILHDEFRKDIEVVAI